jgi:sarcosine oxidase subunit gamma
MSDPINRKSPLYRVLGKGATGLSERAFEGHLILRGDSPDAAFGAAVHATTGVVLPLTPNTVASAGTRRIAWLGPNEWQLTLPGEEAASMHVALEQALAGQHIAVVNVSDGYTVIVLDCPDATEILARDCPLDFHPTSFPVGSCAQSVLGKSGGLFVREAEQRFALCVRRSFAEYLWQLLCHAADLQRRTA